MRPKVRAGISCRTIAEYETILHTVLEFQLDHAKVSTERRSNCNVLWRESKKRRKDSTLLEWSQTGVGSV